MTYPISKGRLINTVALYSEPEREGTTFLGEAVQEVSQDEVLSRFEGWEGEVVQLLKVSEVHTSSRRSLTRCEPHRFQCINKPSRWAILTSKPLSAYGCERIAVLGDAVSEMPAQSCFLI